MANPEPNKINLDFTGKGSVLGMNAAVPTLIAIR